MVRPRSRRKVVGPKETGWGGGGEAIIVLNVKEVVKTTIYTLTEPAKAQNSTSKDRVFIA